MRYCASVSADVRLHPSCMNKKSQIFGFFLTALASLAAGFSFYCALLFVGAIHYFSIVSQHSHKPEFHPHSATNSWVSSDTALGVCFFLSGMLVAQRRWTSFPALASAVGYTVYFVWLLSLSGDETTWPTLLLLALPIVTSFFGAYVFERFSTKYRFA